MSEPAAKKKKNKSKPNPYWCFYKQQRAENPLIKRMGFEESQKKVGEMWNSLDKDEKEKYKMIAKNRKEELKAGSDSSIIPIIQEPERLVAPPPPKLTRAAPTISTESRQPQQPPAKKQKILKDSLGVSIAEREEREAKARAYKKEMDLKVTEIIEKAAENGVIFNSNFHLISAVNFSSDTGVVYPAEIAIGKFSLIQGIHQRLQNKINPGRLPPELENDALDKSEDEHKYSLPGNNDADKTDFVDLLQDILEFLLPETQMPIFYTLERDVAMVKKVLDMIFTKVGESSEVLEVIHVYPVERFLKFLAEKAQAMTNAGIPLTSSDFKIIFPALSISSAMDEFRRLQPTDSCDFHFTKHAEKFCALAKVNGIGYLLADVCCDKRHIEMIEGQHKPLKRRHADQQLAADDFSDI